MEYVYRVNGFRKKFFDIRIEIVIPVSKNLYYHLFFGGVVDLIDRILIF